MAGIRLRGRGSRGVTLIEMLVVISILVALLGIGVPLMAPAMEGRRIREAARQVHVYFGSARNHAVATSQPVGVMIHRFDGLPECAMTLDQVESPPPYNGDTLSSRAQVQWTGGTQITATLSDFNPSLVSTGDLAQFGHQGPYYTITSVGTGGITADLYNPQVQFFPWTGTPSAPVEYTIYRRPTKSMTSPLQLPTGAVIDLQFSGQGSESFGSGSGAVYIMFSPHGAIDRVYSDTINRRVIRPIHLLIGKREKIPTAAGDENWRDFHNIWVSLNPQSGLVTTSEVASAESLDESRALAVDAAGNGGY